MNSFFIIIYLYLSLKSDKCIRPYDEFYQDPSKKAFDIRYTLRSYLYTGQIFIYCDLFPKVYYLKTEGRCFMTKDTKNWKRIFFIFSKSIIR